MTTTTTLCKFVIECVPGKTVSFFVYRKQLLQFECMQCLQCGFAILIQMKQKTEATRAILLLAICKYTHNKRQTVLKHPVLCTCLLNVQYYAALLDTASHIRATCTFTSLIDDKVKSCATAFDNSHNIQHVS